jgi:MoxR-like ATPase
MQSGGICFIDEIAKIRPRALALLVSVLDERRYIDSSLLAERVIAHPGFRFIAATNTGEVNALPEFIRSRMRPVIQIGYPCKTEIDMIVDHQFPGLKERLPKLLDNFWSLWAENRGDGPPPSPRDAIHLFGLASSISDFNRLDDNNLFTGSGPTNPYPLYSATAPDVESEHLEQAFNELFHREASE